MKFSSYSYNYDDSNSFRDKEGENGLSGDENIETMGGGAAEDGGATEEGWGPGGGRGLGSGEGERGICLAVSEGNPVVGGGGTCVGTVHVSGRVGSEDVDAGSDAFFVG